MAYSSPEGSYPSLRSFSGDNAERPVPSSRISFVSDISSPDIYDPEIGQDYQYFVSPQNSFTNLQQRLYDSPIQDGVDSSHVQLSSFLDETPQNDRQFSGSSLAASLRSEPHASPPTASNRPRFPWRQTDQYEPLSPADTHARANTGFTGRFRSKRGSTSRKLSRHQSIPEGDEMDLSLLENANAFSGTSYDRRGSRNVPEEQLGSLGIDITAFTGPANPQDPATAQKYRQLELNGTLTGGLGSGLNPEITLQSKDLYASVPSTSPLEITRRISMRSGGPSRAHTLRDLGQREANRRGKIIEVVVEGPEEEPDPIDLTTYAGHGTPPIEFDPSTNRLSTINPPKAITYYPQPNWKPHSMRWPYLTFLIATSIVLAVATEVLYQKSLYLSTQDPPSGLFEFTSAEDISTWDYFTFKYLPTIVAVSYGILWQVTEYEVKRLEPFYRLSMEGGALAAESINIDYITILSILRPFRALRYRHYAVAVSSFATLFAISLVPTLQSASVVLQPDRDVRLLNPTDMKYINIDPIWSRTLTAVLVVISILGVILLVLLQRRRSGLANDVKGIAGLAAMATKSHVLMDFKDLDTVPPQDIHNKLKNHRYSLRNSSLTSDAAPVTREDQDKYDRFRLSANPHPLMLRLIAGGPFLVSMILFTGFIPLVIFTPANVILDKANWLITAFAVAIKVGFQTLEQDARLMEPFYRLSCRHAHPRVLILDYTTMAIGYMPIRAALNKDYLIALLGLGSVLAEILTVCVTSLAGVSTGVPSRFLNSDATGSTSETPRSFWISFILSLFIMVFLILTATFVYKLRRHPFLPRQPSTIASVLAFIHQSKMLYDFVAMPAPTPDSPPPPRPPPKRSDSAISIDPTATTAPTDKAADTPTPAPGNLKHATEIRPAQTEHDQDLLVQRLAEMGKTYGLGWFIGRDGQTHCGVDQEELKHSYKHKAGDDARKFTMPWQENWEYL